MEERELEILLIEDNPGDAYLIEEIFKREGRQIHFSVADKIETALAFFPKEGKGGKKRPELIILDLNNSKKEWINFLITLKKSSLWSHIPVIVFNASKKVEDVLASYQAHANCYVIKPLEEEAFAEAIKNIIQSWLKVFSLPESF